MTTLQIKFAVAIKELGSISNAAKELGISQPNASNYIKALENEIGFEIYNLTNADITVTEKGCIFLDCAKRILSELNEIIGIRNHCVMFRLRVGAVNYWSAAEPFLKLSRFHRDDEEYDLRFCNVSVDEGIKELDNFNLDIVFVPVKKNQIVGITNACKKNNLDIISLGKVNAGITVRKDHPAIEKGLCENVTLGSDAMKDYPYVAYRNLSGDFGPTNYGDTDFIQSKYIMYVVEITVRLQLVASTDAFIFGITPSKGTSERYNLVSFPFPDITFDLLCLIHKSDHDRKELQEYISLLKEEIELK